MRHRAVAIALLAALPLGLLAAWSLSRNLPRFSDPCFQWGLAQPVSMALAPAGPCRAVSGTSETEAQAVVRLAIVEGGILLAGLLGVMGALFSRPLLTVLGAGLIFLESVLLIFSFAWLTVLVSGWFLVATREIAPMRGAAKAGARLVGSCGALAAMACAPSLAAGAPLFLLFLISALVFVAAAGWWPAATPLSSSRDR